MPRPKPVNKPLPPPPRDSKFFSATSGILAESPEPMSRSSNGSADRRSPIPAPTRGLPPPPRAGPSTKTRAPARAPPERPTSPESIYPRPMIRSPDPPYSPQPPAQNDSKPWRPKLWVQTRKNSQGSVSNGSGWKSSVQQTVMPPTFAAPAPPPPMPTPAPQIPSRPAAPQPPITPSTPSTTEASRPRGGAKKHKFFSGWKLPRFGSTASPTPPVPPLPGNGRYITNLDDPETPPPTHLPQLVPHTPTVYTDYSLAPSDETSTIVTHQRPRISRSTARARSSTRTPRRSTRRLPGPPSTAGASWVTYGRYGQTPAPSTYGGNPSMYAGENRSRNTIGTVNTLPSPADGLSQLASRPATPDQSPLKSSITGTSMPSPYVERPSAPTPGGPSGFTSTIASQYPPETVPSQYPTETVPSQYRPDTEVQSLALSQNTQMLSPTAPSETGTEQTETMERRPSSRRLSRRNTYASTFATDVRNPSTIDENAEDEVEMNEGEVVESPVQEYADPIQEYADSEVGTVGDLSRTNTRVTRSSRFSSKRFTRLSTAKRRSRSDTQTSQQSGTATTGTESRQMREATRENTSRNTPKIRKAARKSRISRTSVFSRISIPRKSTKRFSHRPFKYYVRHPVSSLMDPSGRKGGNIRTSGTSTTRSFIPTRIGRIRRLIRDIINLPWRGDDDYYGGETGITATYHFRKAGGGVSSRPIRDSKIPRQPWYRPRMPSVMAQFAEDGITVNGFPGVRLGMNSPPLTDGSDRGTMDRVNSDRNERNERNIWLASASPFVSPYQMRSPYDSPESPNPPPVPQHAALRYSPPRPVAGSPSAAPYMPSPLGRSPSPRSANTSPGANMFKPPSPEMHARQRSISPPSGSPSPQSTRPPVQFPPPPPIPPHAMGPPRRVPQGVPSTAWESTWGEETEGGQTPAQAPYLVIPGGQNQVWVPATFQNPDGTFGQYYVMPANAVPQPHGRRHRGGVPVTIHASTTPGSSPRMRMKGDKSAVMNDYFPHQAVEIGAAV